ncbi:MAG: 16S rRNA (cytidine(1402)-2'-O)-methyltransferase [Eubacteriales bacterium]|nr:16S rRNA (cytidine(1402)-2'-O)-methyltransferase [Eubacteriales bacterium]
MNNGKAGKLYIVATPIGNLGDMTIRAVEVLKGVDLIAAEDTRNSIKLLNHFEIKTPMTSYHEFNRFDKADELVKKMLEGCNVAIITDAGTPCISDPGEVLVQKCYEAGIEVTSLPGPSAVITALTLSGFSVRRFVFEGFLPPKAKHRERQEALLRIKDETGTIVLYEAPHHLKSCLKDLKNTLGADRQIALCRELTNKYEEITRTTIGEAEDMETRGEYVLVIEGKDKNRLREEKQSAFEEMTLNEHMQIYLDKGMDRKEAMKAVAADRGLSKRDVYNMLVSEE